MRTLVTIGTDDVWAPPRMCGFELTDEMTITNTNEVWWDIFADGWVTRWAMRWPQGWVAIPLPAAVKVGARDTPAIISAGGLTVTVHAPTQVLGRELASAPRFPELPA